MHVYNQHSFCFTGEGGWVTWTTVGLVLFFVLVALAVGTVK